MSALELLARGQRSATNPAASPPGSAASRTWIVGLGAVVALYAAAAITYAVHVPVGSSADELSHLNYARIIADHFALPGATVLERQQPPLYYLAGAGLLRAGAPDVALRLLSVALGAVAVIAVAISARLVAPRRPWLAPLAAAMLALLPGFQDTSASITDDSLAIAAGTVLILLCLVVVRTTAPSRLLTLACSVTAGVALLSKETDYSLVLLLAACVVWRWRARLHPADLARLITPGVLIAGWWYVRNLVTFHQALPPLVAAGGSERPHLRHLGQVRGWVQLNLRELFGPERFQGGLVPLPRAGQVLLAVLLTALALLIAAGIIAALRNWARWQVTLRAQCIVLSCAFLLALGFSVANSVLVDLQPQMRYLLVAATAPALAAAWGTGPLVTRSRLAAVIGVGAALSALALSAVGINAALMGG